MKVVHSSGVDFPVVRAKHRRKQVFFVRGFRRKFFDQYLHALSLMEHNFDLLQHHFDYTVRGRRGDAPITPDLDIECRAADDYMSCHWSR